MQDLENPTRKNFNKSQKLKILNELREERFTISSLAIRTFPSTITMEQRAQ